MVGINAIILNHRFRNKCASTKGIIIVNVWIYNCIPLAVLQSDLYKTYHVDCHVDCK